MWTQPWVIRAVAEGEAMGWGPPEETGGRKSNQLEGGKSWKTSWRCRLPSWGLKDGEELSR